MHLQSCCVVNNKPIAFFAILITLPVVVSPFCCDPKILLPRQCDVTLPLSIYVDRENEALPELHQAFEIASSETQGQIVGARESPNRRKNMAQKKSKARPERAPGDNVLPDQFQAVAAVLASDRCQKNTSFLAPIRSQNGGDHLELVW